MSRNKMSGFTLIELMVVIVIIGVLASLAIPRFTEASVKAKVAEAPRVLASFESAYLAAVAEVGEGNITEDNLDLFKVPSSNWFDYITQPINGTDITGLNAKSKVKLGDILKDEYLYTNYQGGSFTHGFSKCTAPKEAPKDPAPPETDEQRKAREEENAEAAKQCTQLNKYVPNFIIGKKSS